MASPEVLENLKKCHDALKGLQKELQPILAQTECEHEPTRAIARTAVALTVTTLSYASHKVLSRDAKQRTHLRAALNRQRKLLVKLQQKQKQTTINNKKKLAMSLSSKETPVKRTKH